YTPCARSATWRAATRGEAAEAGATAMRHAATVAADIHVRTDNTCPECSRSDTCLRPAVGAERCGKRAVRSGSAAAGGDHAGAVARGERHVAAGDALGPAGGGAQVEAAQDLAQHDPHLHLGEGRADTAPDATAEGDPGVGRRRLVEEALRAERIR